ncbi:MAG: hypothetical protein H6974_13380 [Gammaproteobacteria bacterium]|nr:hypothetical protein [Gammaproteobacteria bacterium]MCP5197755.1 hypothetical protein [Gammaproteobacteria bacterium]
MDWTILILLVGLWLISPIILLIALVVSRYQLAEARRRLAAWEQPEWNESQKSPSSQPVKMECPVTPDVEPIPSPLERMEAESIALSPSISPPKLAPVSPSVSSSISILPPQVETTPVAEPAHEPAIASSPRSGWQLTADWCPTEPGLLERTLQVMSGWPVLIAPFLVQNIGWFIGGFCFVAGALFLVVNTTGFVNALVVFASLLMASAFLIWAGYQFRRIRPELAIASNVLLTLGLMLGPLNLATAMRLFEASEGESSWLMLSALLAVLTLIAFAWAARLTSTLIDRALPRRYAGLLTMLAGMQLAAPLAAILPGWSTLAALHIVLLCLLGDGLRRFTNDWLRQIFLDRRWTGYFAAGMLVYTGVVSFVYLTWVWPESLPAGYSGPLLMTLCLLLCPVDAALKEWMHQYPFLSRFNFALYGLSVVAVVVALPMTLAAIPTFALGAALYGWITWRYLTLPPLYLLFGCLAGLYGYGILQWLPPAWHLLASLPGLLALLALGRWAGLKTPASFWLVDGSGNERDIARSGSQVIAWQCLLTCGLLLVSLTVWSLAWGSPGWLGFVTAMSAVVLSYGAIRWVLTLLDADPKWAYADAGIAVLAMTAVAYTPDWLPFSWTVQIAFGWLMLAALWTGLGLRDQGLSSIRQQVWIGSAVSAIALALVLAGVSLWPVWLGRLEPILLLAFASGLLLWLSLGLRQQSLFYGVLVLVAALGVLTKLGYFPAPGTGLLEFTLVLALWSFLWRLDWRLEIREALLVEMKEVGNRLQVGVMTMIRTPLEQAMALLWAIGLVHLGARLLEGHPSLVWSWAAGLAALSGLSLIGRLHWFYGVALPMLLGLIGGLVGLAQLDVSLPRSGLAAVLYALLVWQLSVTALDRPLTWRLVRWLRFTTPAGSGGRRRVEGSLHGCAMLVASAPVVVGLALGALNNATSQFWPTLGASLLLFILASERYRTAMHVGAALITLTLGIWLVSAWFKSPELFILGQPLVNVGLSLILSLAAIGLTAKHAPPLAYWCKPLWMMGGLLYGLALAGLVLGLLANASGLPVLLVLLCVTLFPLTRPLVHAADWRGLGLALLMSVLAWSVADQAGFDVQSEARCSLGWGYALWGIGNLLLPRWNARFPSWAVAVNLWPLLGLVAVLFSSQVGLAVGAPSLAIQLAGLALYLFLLLRNTSWPGMVGLALAVSMTSTLAAANDWGAPLAWLPLGLALWHGLLLAVWRYGPQSPQWRAALDFWLISLPVASIGLSLWVPADGAVWSVTLLVLAATTLALGWQRCDGFWLKSGLGLALASGYTLWLWGRPLIWVASVALLPWYALQSAVLWVIFAWSRRWLTVRVDARDSRADEKSVERWLKLEPVLGEMASWCLLATLLGLGLHLVSVAAWRLGMAVQPWRFGLPVDALAASATLALLLGWTGMRAWRRWSGLNDIYVAALLLGVLVGYGRLVVLGLTPLTPWDTVGLLTAASAVFLLHQLTGLQPFYRLTVWLPLLALATAPWQLASPWTGGTLLAAGILYLSLAGAMRNPLPLYLGVLALNGAIGLWAPLWMQQYGLWQFYLIPAAVSVLALLHLHRRELRPKVLSGARLAALGVLYAGAGLDVFLQPGLWIFLLALALALTGILLGIALHIRAFLYAGVAFLVLNVSGQILRFYPEQGISRALILLGLGAAITASMVLFNLKREAILQRIRIMRADLAEWE